MNKVQERERRERILGKRAWVHEGEELSALAVKVRRV